jgi:hypothetical protein
VFNYEAIGEFVKDETILNHPLSIPGKTQILCHSDRIRLWRVRHHAQQGSIQALLQRLKIGIETRHARINPVCHPTHQPQIP